jgi:hypothetical protein
MRRLHWLLGLVGLLIVGCGANVVLSEEELPAPVECGDLEECCATACAFVAELPCYRGECECGRDDTEACKSAWIDYLECALPQAEDILVCRDDAPAVRCGACSEERKQVNQTCQRRIRCAD